MKSPNPFPGELWSLIYLNLPDPTSLAMTNRYLRSLLDNPLMISQWIIHRYTLEFAFMGALTWYMDQVHACPKENCSLENRQIQVANQLIQMNLPISNLEDYVMRDASKMGHLKYVEWILKSQNNTTNSNTRNNLLLDAIKCKDIPLIKLLISYNSTTIEGLEMAFMRELDVELFALMVQKLEPTIELILSCMNKASISKWLSLKSRQEIVIKRIVVLLNAISDEIFTENSDRLLVLGSELGSPNLFKHLKERGGNVNLEGGAPLYTALLVGNISLIKYLVSLPDISLDIFSGPRITLLIVCLLDHLAVAYALIATTTSIIAYLICITLGYKGSQLSMLTFNYQSNCANSFGLESNLEQYIVGFCFSIILFGLLQVVMPFYGILGSLYWIFLSKKKRRIRRIHPQNQNFEDE